MNERTSRTDRVLRTTATTLLSMLLPLAATGCDSTAVARRYLQAGQPMQAVRVLEDETTNDPDNAAAASQLKVAQAQAATQLAGKAEAALDAGQPQQALRLVQQAVEYDRAHRDLESEIRRQIAHSHLQRAETLLDRHEFDSAGRAIDDAAAVAPNLPEIAQLRQDVARAHAKMLAERARSLAQSGAFSAAIDAAESARQRLAGSATYARLPQEIDAQRRRAQFDELAASAQRTLHAGDLDTVDELIARMQTLDVRHERLKQLQADREDREQRIADALESAQQAEQAGEFDKAVHLYKQAAELAPNRHAIQAQRQAATKKQEAATLHEKGRLAFEQGAYEQALRFLNQSLDIRVDEQTLKLIGAARTAEARQTARQALNDNELTSAIAALQTVVQETDDTEAEQKLARLRSQLADQALQRANAAAAEGNVASALQTLKGAMQYTSDERVAERHTQLSVRRHREQAAAAEQARQFVVAREHWRAALALDGDQPGVTEHLKNVQALAEMEQKMRAAQQEASHLSQTVAALRHTRSQLRYEIEDQERELQQKANRIEDLKRDLSRAGYDRRQFERTLHNLKYEISSLENKIYQCKHDVEYWKDKYYHCKRHPH